LAVFTRCFFVGLIIVSSSGWYGAGALVPPREASPALSISGGFVLVQNRLLNW
jgi:hypothetical protein